MNKAALNWKAKCYPIGRSDGYHYLNISELFNKEGMGFIQKIEPFEKVIFTDTENKLTEWRKITPAKQKIENFYKQIDDKIIGFYSIK